MRDGLSVDVRRFVARHRACGPIIGDADAPTFNGYRLWLACDCGAGWERWVTPEMALDDLVHSGLPALPN